VTAICFFGIIEEEEGFNAMFAIIAIINGLLLAENLGKG
jgi:hypothetical protein